MVAEVVRAAVERDIALLAKRDASVGSSAFAAAALVLADEMDAVGTSATAKAVCSKALLEVLDRLSALVLAAAADDRVDDLSSRREKRKAAV